MERDLFGGDLGVQAGAPPCGCRTFELLVVRKRGDAAVLFLG